MAEFRNGASGGGGKVGNNEVGMASGGTAVAEAREIPLWRLVPEVGHREEGRGWCRGDWTQ